MEKLVVLGVLLFIVFILTVVRSYHCKISSIESRLDQLKKKENHFRSNFMTLGGALKQTYKKEINEVMKFDYPDYNVEDVDLYEDKIALRSRSKDYHGTVVGEPYYDFKDLDIARLVNRAEEIKLLKTKLRCKKGSK